MRQILEVLPGDPLLDEVYPVLAELRTELAQDDFRARYEHMYREEGYRIAALFEAGRCRAVAGYRIQTSMAGGRFLYIDDFVTTAGSRSRGFGRGLNGYLVDVARRQACASVQLDSGAQRHGAHRFYFREGYVIPGYHFIRAVD